MTKKNNKIIIPLLVFLAFILGASWSYLVINQLNKGTVTTSGSGGSYTINENSISGAVDKIYDATVTVQTYKNGSAVSTGTGFVYKKEGSTAYIMTNNHVISGGDSAKVVFSDGTSADTKILGGETYADIAVLTVSAASVKQVATLGSTKDIKLGDTTFAVGAPLGDTYSGTVTKGILSGKDRLVAVSFSGTTSDYYMKVLQTDAALNPGNSGGPLCNVNGEVIGVISMKLVKEEIEGMGFAIPIEYAMSKIETLEKGEEIKWPQLGVQMVNVSDVKQSRFGNNYNIPNDVKTGVVVAGIVSGTGASKSDLKEGDIITKLNGEEVENAAYLRYELYKYAPGDTITLTYLRDGKEHETKAVLSKSE